MAQSAIWTANPSPRAIESSMVAEKSGIASTGRPRYPASNRSQVAARRMPVTSLITSFSAASDVAVSKSPHCVATIPRPFKRDGQRGEGARCAGELDMPGAQRDPAVEVPHRHGRHLGENSPLQPLLPGHVITEECVHCSPQGRLCCSRARG